MNKNNNTNGMQKINYQKLLDKITDRIGMECAEGNNRPSLFLHACCAPCSSYVLEYLVKYFKITIFYYNPNITPETEYIKRVKELKRFIREVGYENDVTFVEGTYDPQVFFDMAKGMEDLPERGLRCYHCYALRMEEAAKKTAGVKDAVVNFMTLKMTVEFEDGADVKAVMQDVIKNCKIVEDDCEIFL